MQYTIIPFKATHYNIELFKDLSDLICPPYDVIDKEQLRYFRNKSSYNFSHILLAVNDNYKILAERFNEWLKNKILVDEGNEALYFYCQHFKYENRVYERLGIISLLCMDKKELIFPHENTLSKPKEDRKKIIEEVRSNLSPIFVVALKPLKIFSELYNLLKNTKPFFKFTDFENNKNFVWKISDKKNIEHICKVFQNEKLIIADGHHRFEVAYEYYCKNKDNFKNLNYILAYITHPQEGLLVLPTHRIFSVFDKKDEIFEKLSVDFLIKPTSEEKLQSLFSKNNTFCFGMYINRKFYFLKLKNEKRLNSVEQISVYRKLDTYLFNHLVLPLLNLTSDDTIYIHTIKEVKKLTKEGKVAFILREIPLKNIFQVAKKGFRLPQKSTYFYPKIPSGIVLRRFEVK